MTKANFYYDPQKQDYDASVWQTITGTPAVSANQLVLNTAAIISQADFQSGEITMNITCPLAPVAGQDKRFGLAQLNYGAYVGFRMTDDKFYYESVGGSESFTATEITWDSAWTNAETSFKIVWNNFNVEIFIGTNKIATLNTGFTPNIPLGIYLKNADGDDLKLKYVQIKNADVFVPMNNIDATVSINAEDIEIGAVELKNASDDTRAIVNAANTARVATNPVVLTQGIDASGNVVSTASPNTLTAGEKTVASSGTAEALGASLVTKSIYIRAKTANTGNVYIGDSSVDKTSSQQVILSAGSAVSMDIGNRSSVYVDADVNTEGVDYLCFS
jgi:hypothetical protein